MRGRLNDAGSEIVVVDAFGLLSFVSSRVAAAVVVSSYPGSVVARGVCLFLSVLFSCLSLFAPRFSLVIVIRVVVVIVFIIFAFENAIGVVFSSVCLFVGIVSSAMALPANAISSVLDLMFAVNRSVDGLVGTIVGSVVSMSFDGVSERWTCGQSVST